MADDSQAVTSEEGLRKLYKEPSQTTLKATTNYLHPFHLAHLEKASFVCIGTVAGSGLDVSPRGGEPGFVKVIGKNCVGIPDWPGNNKIETLSNLTADNRIGLLFIFPGLDYFMRLNGKAAIRSDAATCAKFAHDGKVPKTVIAVDVDQAYFHCGKAINRAHLWEPGARIPRGALPSPGTMMAELGQIADVPPAALDEVYEKGLRDGLYDPPPDMPGAKH